MLTSISCVSFQLFESVIQYLQLEDLRSTRHEAAPPLLLKPAWISSATEDRNIITATASHRISRGTVPKIAYDGTIYDERLNNEGFERSKWIIVWPFSDTELVAGFWQYR